jgi:hypothetical protein
MAIDLEDHLVVFIDLLGTIGAIREASRSAQLLDLLVHLRALAGEYSFQSDPTPDGTGHRINIRPAISSFSDHIVMSFPIEHARRTAGFRHEVVDRLLLNHMQSRVCFLAASALRIGFLLRGGATIGKLYHSDGVVFGEALVEAYEIESRTSIYPRIVASPKLIDPYWSVVIHQDDDGLHHLDYFKPMLFAAVRVHPSHPSYNVETKTWFDQVVGVIDSKLSELARAGTLNEFAKWSWFARKWRAALMAKDVAESLKALGISPDALPSGDPLITEINAAIAGKPRNPVAK